ncbi:ABC transporter permease subunit [Rhodobacterales bacterium HKCCE3408]|nr:ABC transporter permease subunit [Rhodobacterales bacterium HKCCE3408]
MSGLWWLANNTVQNLAALGKDFDFGFLSNRAGYDINQRLIEYSNNSTHGRAALVGILNTLLVAVLGCICATIIGIFAGVLRLSKNWIVARLMTVYVEGFRNIPLLLWIIVIFAVMTESAPQPRDFRENGSASMILFDSVAVTNRGIFIPKVVFTRSLGGNEVHTIEEAAPDAEEEAPRAAVGVYGSSRIATGGAGGSSNDDAAVSARDDDSASGVSREEGEIIPTSSGTDWVLILGVLLASVVGARFISRWATARQEATGIRPKGAGWMQIGLIVLPVVAVLIALGATLEYPSLQGFNFGGGIQLRNSLIALWFALSLYTGAFIAEIVRAGILSVSKGQTEAAFALGLRPSRTMNLVILPQALRVIVPPLISQYLNLTKNSSLAIAVGYMDVRSTLGGITINQTGRELEGMLLLGLFYLATSLVISGAMNLYNNSVKLKER